MRFICLWKWLSTEAVQDQVASSEESVSNYHITVKHRTIRKGRKTLVQRSMSASVERWHRIYSKIDKNAGKVTNQLEVIADANVDLFATIRTSGNKPYSSLKSSKYGCSKRKGDSINEGNSSRGSWKTFWVREDLYRKRWRFVRHWRRFWIATTDTSKVELKIKQMAGNLITNVEIKVTDEERCKEYLSLFTYNLMSTKESFAAIRRLFVK